MKKPLIVLACAAALLGISGCTGITVSSKPVSTVAPQADQTASAPAQAKESSFKDGVLVTPQVKIAITSHKIIPVGAVGNEYGKKPVMAFWYKITNVNGEKVTPLDFIRYIAAYQDNNPNSENKLNVGGLPDIRFNETQLETVKKGGTVENAMSFELDDLKTSVDLVGSVNYGLDTVGKVTYLLK